MEMVVGNCYKLFALAEPKLFVFTALNLTPFCLQAFLHAFKTVVFQFSGSLTSIIVL